MRVSCTRASVVLFLAFTSCHGKFSPFGAKPKCRLVVHRPAISLLSRKIFIVKKGVFCLHLQLCDRIYQLLEELQDRRSEIPPKHPMLGSIQLMFWRNKKNKSETSHFLEIFVDYTLTALYFSHTWTTHCVTLEFYRKHFPKLRMLSLGFVKEDHSLKQKLASLRNAIFCLCLNWLKKIPIILNLYQTKENSKNKFLLPLYFQHNTLFFLSFFFLQYCNVNILGNFQGKKEYSSM